MEASSRRYFKHGKLLREQGPDPDDVSSNQTRETRSVATPVSRSTRTQGAWWWPLAFSALAWPAFKP